MSDKYDDLYREHREERRAERTLEEVKTINPGLTKLAEQAAKASPWKWDTQEILKQREKALGTPLKDNMEAVRETHTPFADNLAAIRGQPVPARDLPEHLINEPETRVARYGTDDYDKLYAPTALKDTIEAVKEREEDRSK